MNKKLMAVAVAGALAVPGMALAQSSTVQIGGSITAFYYKHSPKNASTGQSGDILEPSEPELYFHGEEKLGGGLSAWFRCTSQMDGMIGGSAAAASNGGWCNRNSGVGFKGGFGNIFVGNWDTPQKLVMNRARGWFGSTNSLTGGTGRLLFGNGPSGIGNPVRSTAGFFTAAGSGITGTTSNTPGGFARRHSNAWNYWSPSWNGFTVNAAYSADNNSTARSEASILDPRLMSVGANYSSGPLYLGAAYEKHDDFNPANIDQGVTAAQYGGGNDHNWTLVAGYKFGTFDVRGMYIKSSYDTTNSTSLDVKGWALYADWAIQGPHTLRGQFVKVNDTSGNAAVNIGAYKGPLGATCGPTSAVSCASDTGAKVWSLAYSYAFSKRTEGSLIYTKLDNDMNGAFSLGKTAASAGNSQTSTGIVLKHRF